MNNFDGHVRAVMLCTAWDRADAAARKHPVKGPLLRLLDSADMVIIRLKTLVKRF